MSEGFCFVYTWKIYYWENFGLNNFNENQSKFVNIEILPENL